MPPGRLHGRRPTGVRIRPQVALHRGVGRPRLDHVAPDSGRRQLEPGAAGERRGRGLGRGVRGHADPRHRGGIGADDDHGRPGAQSRRRGPQQMKGAGGVDVELKRPVGVGQRGEPTGSQHAGGDHDRAWVAEGGRQPGDGGLDLLRSADVGDQRQHALLRGRRQVVQQPVQVGRGRIDGTHPVALPKQGRDHRSADPAGRTADQRSRLWAASGAGPENVRNVTPQQRLTIVRQH